MSVHAHLVLYIFFKRRFIATISILLSNGSGKAEEIIIRRILLIIYSRQMQKIPDYLYEKSVDFSSRAEARLISISQVYHMWVYRRRGVRV